MDRRFFCLLILAGAFCRPASAATEQWTEIRSAHFTVITDANEKQGRHIADQFERMRWVFQTLYPKANVDPAEPIVVIAAKNQKVFQTMEPAAYLAKGQMKLGGYYSHTEEKNYILCSLMPNMNIRSRRSITSTRTCSLWAPRPGCRYG